MHSTLSALVVLVTVLAALWVVLVVTLVAVFCFSFAVTWAMRS